MHYRVKLGGKAFATLVALVGFDSVGYGVMSCDARFVLKELFAGHTSVHLLLGQVGQLEECWICVSFFIVLYYGWLVVGLVVGATYEPLADAPDVLIIAIYFRVQLIQQGGLCA